jgi:hypothetical protein
MGFNSGFKGLKYKIKYGFDFQHICQIWTPVRPTALISSLQDIPCARYQGWQNETFSRKRREGIFTDTRHINIIICWQPTMRGPSALKLHRLQQRLRWSRGSVLAFGTQVRGFAPGRSRRIFRAKHPQHVCKRSLNVTCKSAFRQNYRVISRPKFHLPPLGALAWWHAWRRLVAKVGTSNQDRTISLEGWSA